MDRARKVAQTYRLALQGAEPEACTRIDQAARDAGEGWVCPQLTTDEWVPVATAAEVSGRSRRWVYAWIERDAGRWAMIDGRLHVWLGDVLQT